MQPITLKRAVEDPLVNLALGQDQLVTALVLGQPAEMVFPSQRILKPITVDSLAYKWTSFGVERLRRYDTRRGLRAEIKTADWAVSYNTGTLKRYSFAVPKDDAELAAALPSLNVRERSAAMARMIVEKDIESIAASLLTTVTTYPVSHRLAIAGGSEWDTAGGDSKADVQSIVEAICDDTGLQKSQLSVFLGRKAYEAAQKDPVLAAQRLYTGGIPPATSSLLAEYWDVGEVWTANPIIAADHADTVSPMYGDVAIVYYNGGGQAWDTSYGDLTFGATFGWSRGASLEPYRMPNTTTWYFPWETWVEHNVINNLCGGIITNCHS